MSAPSQRRSVAPDMVGCSLVIYAATLSFAVMRAPYFNKDVVGIVRDVVIYGALLLSCGFTAIGVFQRRSWALGPALLISLVTLVAGASAWHVPDTAQLPAAVLGATGLVFLLARRGEFGSEPATADSDAESDADADAARDDEDDR